MSAALAALLAVPSTVDEILAALDAEEWVEVYPGHVQRCVHVGPVLTVDAAGNVRAHGASDTAELRAALAEHDVYLRRTEEGDLFAVEDA